MEIPQCDAKRSEYLAEKQLSSLMLGVVEKSVRFIFLNYIEFIHENHTVGDGLGKGHLVGYHDHSHSCVGQLICHLVCRTVRRERG